MGDLSTSQTFVAGGTVTATKLNDIIGGATIADGVVTDAKLRSSAALSVIGNATNASAAPADITAGSDGQVLRRSGTAVGFGTVATAGIADAAVTSAKLRNSAALSVIGNGTNASAAPSDLTAGTDGHVLRRSGTAVAFGTVAAAGLAAAAVTAPKLDGVGKDTSGSALGVGTAPVFGVRAWVIFDGTRNAADSGASVNGGTVKILGAGNVASVTRGNGSGRFTIAFTTNMAHATYAAVANHTQTNNDVRSGNAGQASCHTHAVDSVQVVCVDGSSDASPVRVSVMVIC